MRVGGGWEGRGVGGGVREGRGSLDGCGIAGVLRCLCWLGGSHPGLTATSELFQIEPTPWHHPKQARIEGLVRIPI